jgi:signal transduction histidine kinase
VSAVDPDRAMSQYIQDRWGSERGFPGNAVHAITQSEDGYLWIAADKGLVRFDGLSFRLFEPLGSRSEFGAAVLGVASAPDGTLWARLRGPAVVRYGRGGFEDVFSTLGRSQSVVTAMIRRNDGALLLATLGQGVVEYRDGRLTTFVAPELISNSFAIAIAETRDGDVWLGTRDAGLMRVRGAAVTRVTKGLPDLKINCLLAGDAADLLIGTDRGIARWTGAAVATEGLPDSIRNLPALAMLRDRDANVWIAGGARGVFRVNRHGVPAHDQHDPQLRGNVTALYEDRDANVWIGTSSGIERWRDGTFASYSMPQGLPSRAMGPLYIDAAQRTWFAPTEGGLYWLRDGRIEQVSQAGLHDDVVYSIAGGGDEVWVGRQRGGLTRIQTHAEGFIAQRFTHADGLAQDNVYAVHRARDGAVWAGTLSAGVSRFKNGRFTNYDTADGLGSNTVAAVMEGTDGTMWFATPNGISTFSRGGWRRYSTSDGLASNDVNVLLEDSAGIVWAGTADGLAMFEEGRAKGPRNAPTVLRRSVLGLAEDRHGWLWISAADRVFRVNRDGLARGLLGATDIREYGVADGLLALEGVKRHRSVAADSRGRIWFSMATGLSMADPARVDRPASAPLAHVETLAADGQSVDLLGGGKIPAGRQRITLAYAGLSLSLPERVLFRYRLDGFDREWSAPVSERQAVYTNLGPGTYRFRVKASSGDGLWESAEASLPFEVEPTLWQTTWFQVLALLACALGAFALYRIRVMRVASRLNLRFEERLAERTRIAQELHDTLLQGFISASLQLHVAAERVPDNSPAKAPLSHVANLMRQVIDEGRNAVRGLRASATSDDLEQAFSRIPDELGSTERVSFRVIVEGQPRPLNPIIRDEVYRIGREALVNAFRHSGGASIEVALEYSARRMRLVVRDNGRGIDPDVVKDGRDGHWGLSGMRERADRIGAGFTVWSRPATGTEVELVIPDHVAFHTPRRPARNSKSTHD